MNASTIEVFLSIICRSLSFGITTNVSTFPFKLSIPLSACVSLFLPSNVNGFVTTPIVNIPISFAQDATIGAAPVPVPPPIPAVTNTMSAPLRASVISALLSSAAWAPMSGLAPAPSPLVIFSPIWIFDAAFDKSKACLSVFTAMNSTPFIPESTILFTAFVPAPPTPITLIVAVPSSIVFSSTLLSTIIKFIPPYSTFCSLLSYLYIFRFFIVFQSFFQNYIMH